MSFPRRIRVWENAPKAQNDFFQNYNRNNLSLTSNSHLSKQPPLLRSANVHSSSGFSSGSVNTHLNHVRGFDSATPRFNRGISESNYSLPSSNKHFEGKPILNNMEWGKIQLRQQTSPINQREPIRNFEQQNQTSNGMQPQGQFQQTQSDNILRQQVFLHPPPLVNNSIPLQTHPQQQAQFQQPPQAPVFSNSGQQQPQFPQPQIPLFSNSAQQLTFQPPQSLISGQQQAQFQQPQSPVPVFSSQQQPKFGSPVFGNSGPQETQFPPQSPLLIYGSSGQPQTQFQQAQFRNVPQNQPPFVPGTLQGNVVSPSQVQRGAFLPIGQPQFQNPMLVNMGQNQNQQGLLPNNVRPTFHQNQMLDNIGESQENKTQISDYSPSLQKTSVLGSAFQQTAICGNVGQPQFQSTPMSGNFGHQLQFHQRPIFNQGLQRRPLISTLPQQQMQFQPRSATGIVRQQQIQFQPRSIISNIAQHQTLFQHRLIADNKEQKQMSLLGNLNQASQPPFAGRFSNDRSSTIKSWNQNPSFNNNRSYKFPSSRKINFENRMGNGNRNRNNSFGMKEKHSSKQNIKEMPFSCDTCDRAFSQEDELKRHVGEHVKCKINGCQFEAHFKVVALHQKMQHDTGYADAISKLDNAEEIEKWRKARRSNFPTTENVRKRKAEQAEKEARGEVLETKDFGKFKRARTGQNNSIRDGSRNPRNGRNRFRNNRRRNDSNPRPLRSSSQKIEVVVIDSDSDDDAHIKLPRFGGLSALLKQELSDAEDQSDVVYEKSVEASTELTQSKLPVSIALKKLPLPTQCDSSEILDSETNSSKPDEGKDIESHGSRPIHEESVIHVEDSDVLSSETVDLVSSSNEQNGILDSDDEAPSVEPIQKTLSADNPIVADEAVSKLLGTEQAASENCPKKDYKRNDDGSNMNKNFNRYNRAVPHPVKKSTLLEKLLADDIRHERNVILQCVRHIVNNSFFDK